MVAANAWPARIARDGTLHVNTSSSAWAFELGQLAPDDPRAAARGARRGAPKALRFAPGHLPEPAADERRRGSDGGSRAERGGAADGRPSWPPGSRTRSSESGSQRAVALGLSTAPSDHRF